MSDIQKIDHTIKDPLELNLYYMPFIKGGGLFVPSVEAFKLGDRVVLTLKLPSQEASLDIEGKVVWITPKNALHQVSAGIGIQFIGEHAAENRKLIEKQLDPSVEPGGYTF